MATTTPTRTLEHVQLTGSAGHPTALTYTLVRSQRRTIGLEVGGNGLTVRAPLHASHRAIEGVLHDRARWIADKLQHMQQRQAAQPRILWQPHTDLPYLGGTLRLQLHPHAAAHGDVLAVGQGQWAVHLRGTPDASGSDIRMLAWAWWLRQARQVLTARLQHYAPLLGVRWQSLRLSNARTRWGSAHSDGRIMLNAKLLHYRLPVLDYVVAHELAHLHEMNHSPRFWAWVAQACPDHRALRAELRGQSAPQW